MSEGWDEKRLQQYINDEVQESLTLDYKAAGSLAKDDKKKKEITKDVSAMANSTGGVIIYGISEFSSKAKQHLPEKLDPIDQTTITKEWLEQVINNIRPRIDGIVIHPVQLASSANDVAYVVEIPQSTTAHQATNHKYYKRFNFQSVSMEDYEIRDVMGRNQHPKIELNFRIELTTETEYLPIPQVPDLFGRTEPLEKHTKSTLYIFGENIGNVYAKYVNLSLQIPLILKYRDEHEDDDEFLEDTFEIDGQSYYEVFEDNTVRDIVDIETGGLRKYGPARFDPILPKLGRTWEIELNRDFPNISLENLSIEWSVYADNAPVNTGTIAVSNIEVDDLRETG